MVDDDLGFRDISDLRKELEVMKGKKDITTKELYDAVQRLTQTMSGMLEIFGAAAEQMKLEEKEYGADVRKHEILNSKLDKIIEHNKTIAEAMIGVVDMLKEKVFSPAKIHEGAFKPKEEFFFRPKPEPRPFMKPQQDWQPRPEPIVRRAESIPPSMRSTLAPSVEVPMMPPPMHASMPPPPDLDAQMPPMEPMPSPDLDFPADLGLDEEHKKKGLFGMFKK
ncbi:MAG: hypothetical protein AABX33_02330 [Nanoarchaeota archaeon]